MSLVQNNASVRENAIHYFFFVRVAGIGLDSRPTSRARSDHRLAARLASLARSAVRFSLPRHNDATLAGITCLLADHCARGGTRTHMTFRSTNFKSVAATNYATRAYFFKVRRFSVETQAGLEPAHNAFAERRVDQLRHWVFFAAKRRCHYSIRCARFRLFFGDFSRRHQFQNRRRECGACVIFP